MANERGRNKKKRELKKIDRLKRLSCIDLCACVGSHQLRCGWGSTSVCRDNHTNTNTGKVECSELYQIESSEVKQGGTSRQKRGWRFGRQKEGNENIQDKEHRREKMDRDRSE